MLPTHRENRKPGNDGRSALDVSGSFPRINSLRKVSTRRRRQAEQLWTFHQGCLESLSENQHQGFS